MNVVVNTSNLHIGGGIQVASSLIEELAAIDCDTNYRFTIIASTEVSCCLSEMVRNSSVINVIVYDVFGVSNIIKNNYRLRSIVKSAKADLVWSIFGPSYFIMPGVPHIVGFANALLVGDIRELSFRTLSRSLRIINKTKYVVQKLFLSFEADCLVTETQSMKLAINDDFLLCKKEVGVISNCHSALYLHPEQWRPVDIPTFDVDYVFCTIASNYPHKNLDIIADVGKELLDVYGISAMFLITIPDLDYQHKSSLFKEFTYNLGVVSPYSCPFIYKAADALFLPTLLETFSASYPEAMIMDKTIFTSKLPFAEEACSESAFYFDPLDKADIAKVISSAFSDKMNLKKKRLLYPQVLDSFPNASDRLKQYLSFFEVFYRRFL